MSFLVHPYGRPLRVVHAVLTGVLATLVVVDPGGRRRRRAAYPAYVTGFQAVDRVMRRVAPPLFLSTVAAGALATAGNLAEGRRVTALRGLSVGLVVAAIRITLAVNDPLNQRLRRWSADHEPADWQQVRARWEHGHRMRCAMLVAALAALVAAQVSTTGHQGR